MTISTDLIYDVLRKHQPDHLLLRAARADAATGLLDIKRLSEMLSRIQGRIIRKPLEHVSPLAVPVMLEIGRETVYGEASDVTSRRSCGRACQGGHVYEGGLGWSRRRQLTVRIIGRMKLNWLARSSWWTRRGCLLAVERILAVADLHFEKASSFARFGALLPPYDTAATLARLCEVIMRYRPRAVFALGDSFHDGDGPQRLGDVDRDAINALQNGRDWVWIAGNHDPDPAVGVGGGVFTPEMKSRCD